MSAKLRAAIDYLGDKLSTHRASRFKPAKRYLLDEWLAARQAARQPRFARADASSSADRRKVSPATERG